jgi:DNA-binding transcriptional LysR family regulator
MIELRHLRYFLAVVDEGQVSRAAVRLHVAQPAVSHAVMQLERHVGIELLRRHARGVEPTRAGDAFAEKARAALRLVDEAAEAAFAQRPARPLVLGFLAPWNEIATQIVAAAIGAEPSREVQIREVDPCDPLGPLVDGRLDAVFIWEPFCAPEVVLEPVLRDRMMVCVAEGHPLAGRETLTFDLVEHHPVPAVPDGVPREWADRWHLGHRRAVPVAEVGPAPRTIDEAVALIATGRALCLGPETLASAFVRPGVVARPLLDADPIELSVALRRDDRRPIADAMLEAARAVRTDRDGRQQVDADRIAAPATVA